jgi:hypothetical protein
MILVVGLVAAGGIKLTNLSFAALPTGTLDAVAYDGSNKSTQCTSPSRVNTRRFSNQFLATGPDYFYTASQSFANGTNGYGEENGAAWFAYSYQAAGTVPFYQAWNPAANVQNHFYATNFQDITNAAYYGWQYEGVEGYISATQQAGTVPLYHIYNASTNAHYYSTNLNDINFLKYVGGYGNYIDASHFVEGYVWTDSGSSCYSTSLYNGNELGSVRVETAQGGSGVDCSPTSGTTDPNGGSNHGHVHLTCPAASDGGPRAYKFVSATRDGYALSASSPHPAGDTFHISGGQTTTLSLVLDKSASSTSSSSASTTSSSTSTSTSTSTTKPTSTSTTTSTTSTSLTSTANQKNGSTQVTTYVYHPSDGSRTRLGGINVHIQSAGFPTVDTAHSCDNYDDTTKSSGTPTTNSDYGQVQFNNCWTGSGGKKTYQLSYVLIPSGYKFRSYRITAPSGATFLSGNTSTTAGIGEQFNVIATQTTKLEVWLTKNDETDSSSVRQILTQSGVRYTAVNDSDAAKQAATVLNTISGNPSHLPDPDDADEDDSGEDTNPPSIPTNLQVKQDDSGSVSVTWDASKGDTPSEAITYTVLRTIKGSTDDPDDVGENPTTDLTAYDSSEDLAHPQTYIYSVYATDDSENDSKIATIEFTTKVLSTNVHVDPTPPEAAAGAEATAADDPGPDTGGGTIASADNNVTVDIPAAAADQELACDVSQDDNTGSDLLASIGQPVGDTYTPTCRDDKGDIDTDLDSDVTMDATFDDNEDTSDADLYGYDGTDWVEIDTSDSTDGSAPLSQKEQTKIDNKHGTLSYTSATRKKSKDKKIHYTITTKKLYAIALVKKQHNRTGAIFPVTTLTALVLLGAGVWFFVKRRLENMYSAIPYGDVDLIPQQQYPSAYAPQTQAPAPVSVSQPQIIPLAPVGPPQPLARQPVTPPAVLPETQIFYPDNSNQGGNRGQ